MIKLSTTAKLPLEICKGSYEKRFELAKSLNENLYNNLTKKIKEKDISPNLFDKNIRKLSNDKINFHILDAHEVGFQGFTSLATGPTNTNIADRFNIYLPLNPYDKKVSILDTNAFMHEFFHLFCEISNPKHSQRAIKMFEKNLLPTTEPFYSKELYSKQNINIEKLKNKTLPEFLNKLPEEDQIDFLQNSRYRLKEELQAYKEGHKYNNKIQNEHEDLIYEKSDCENGDSYHFKEKINILETKLKQVLSNVRKNLNSK